MTPVCGEGLPFEPQGLVGEPHILPSGYKFVCNTKLDTACLNFYFTILLLQGKPGEPGLDVSMENITCDM